MRATRHISQGKEENSGSQAQCIERISPWGSSSPFLEYRKSKYSRLSEESEKESRDEATKRGMEELYHRHEEAGGSCFVLNPAADW